MAYISRSLTPTEQRCAQIEKDALAFPGHANVSLTILDRTTISHLDRSKTSCTTVQHQGAGTDTYSSTALSSSNDALLIHLCSQARKGTDHSWGTRHFHPRILQIQIATSYIKKQMLSFKWWCRACQPQRTGSSRSEIANNKMRHAS